MPVPTPTRPRRPRDLDSLITARHRLASTLASLQAHDLPAEDAWVALVRVEETIAARYPRTACALTRGEWLRDATDPHQPGQTCMVCTGLLP